jgi:hypothetical protein
MTINLKGGLVALALLASAMPAAAQTVEFTLINNSTRDLHYFYTSPSNDSSWGYDLLGDDGILQSGYQGTVTIGDGSDQCEYDFKFVMEDESETVINGVDICSLNEYTIYD